MRDGDRGGGDESDGKEGKGLDFYDRFFDQEEGEMEMRHFYFFLIAIPSAEFLSFLLALSRATTLNKSIPLPHSSLSKTPSLSTTRSHSSLVPTVTLRQPSQPTSRPLNLTTTLSLSAINV